MSQYEKTKNGAGESSGSVFVKAADQRTQSVPGGRSPSGREAKISPDRLQEGAKTETSGNSKGSPAKKVRNAVKAAAFLLALLLTIVYIKDVLGISDIDAYSSMETMYEEEPGKVDALYFGGSNVYAFWEPAFGWQHSGIAVQSCAVSAIPARAIRNLIIEARKTQPDALCIINLNTFRTNTIGYARAHRILNYMHLSSNKLDLINICTEGTTESFLRKIEYCFPLLRFHERWASTNSWDYYKEIKENGMNSFYHSYLELTLDVSGSYVLTEETVAEEEESALMEVKYLEELLDYLESENIPALFVVVPQALEEAVVQHLNTLCQNVEERGFPCLNLRNDLSLTSISAKRDFYDASHVNIHGSVKFSRVLADYLVENYGFEDKRGQSGWEKWDAETAQYLEAVSPYALPFELDFSPRSLEIPVPRQRLVYEDGKMRYSWAAVKDAEFYLIYRKVDSEGWELAAEVEERPLVFYDEDLEVGHRYKYTVVPCRIVDGETRYGSFRYQGTGKWLRENGSEAEDIDEEEEFSLEELSLEEFSEEETDEIS